MIVKLALWERAQLYVVLANSNGPAGYVRQVGKILDRLSPPEDKQTEVGWQPITVNGFVQGFARLSVDDTVDEIDLPPEQIAVISEAVNNWTGFTASPAINRLLDKVDDWTSQADTGVPHIPATGT